MSANFRNLDKTDVIVARRGKGMNRVIKQPDPLVSKSGVVVTLQPGADKNAKR